MAAGTVKWFNDERGYGLIAVDDHSRDAYVHYSDVGDDAKTLAAGAAVEFRLEKGEKLDRARSVVPAGTAVPEASDESSVPAEVSEAESDTDTSDAPEPSPESDDDTP